MLNPALLKLAQHRVWRDTRTKTAATPPMGGDPSMGGGMPPGGGGMDPSMMGGGMPPGGGMDPSMMGGGMGAAPATPAAPAAPAGMPGQPNPAMAVQDPAAQMAGGMPPQKLKPEQMMQMLDFRLYNMQQQITAMMNAQGIQLPPGALVTPPGSPTPVAEAAVPGGPNDPGPQAGAGGGGDPSGGAGGGSAINPISPIQGASPDLASGGGGDPSGGAKTASFRDLMNKLAAADVDEDDTGDEDYAAMNDNNDDANADGSAESTNFDQSQMGEWMDDNTKTAEFGLGQPFPAQLFSGSPSTNAAALAQLLRQRTQR